MTMIRLTSFSAPFVAMLICAAWTSTSAQQMEQHSTERSRGVLGDKTFVYPTPPYSFFALLYSTFLHGEGAAVVQRENLTAYTHFVFNTRRAGNTPANRMCSIERAPDGWYPSKAHGLIKALEAGALVVTVPRFGRFPDMESWGDLSPRTGVDSIKCGNLMIIYTPKGVAGLDTWLGEHGIRLAPIPSDHWGWVIVIAALLLGIAGMVLCYRLRWRAGVRQGHRPLLAGATVLLVLLALSPVLHAEEVVWDSISPPSKGPFIIVWWPPGDSSLTQKFLDSMTDARRGSTEPTAPTFPALPMPWLRVWRPSVHREWNPPEMPAGGFAISVRRTGAGKDGDLSIKSQAEFAVAERWLSDREVGLPPVIHRSALLPWWLPWQLLLFLAILVPAVGYAVVGCVKLLEPAMRQLVQASSRFRARQG